MLPSRSLLAGCVMVLWLCQVASPQGIRIVELPHNEGQPSPVTIPLTKDGDIDVSVMFGLQLLNDIHIKQEECDLLMTKAIRRFEDERQKLQKYFNETEQIISKPQFDELSHENRIDLEENFRKAFKDVEQSRRAKIRKIQTKCEKQMDRFIYAKVDEAIRYAEHLLHHDPTQFMELCFNAAGYAVELRKVLFKCSQPTEREMLVTFITGLDVSVNELCEGGDIALMVTFIDLFLARADELSRRVYGDDEDYEFVHISSGDGGEYEYEDSEESGDFEPEDNEAKPTKPPKKHHKPRPHGKKRRPQSTVTPTMSEKEEKEKLAGNFINSLEPGPVMISPKEGAPPTTEAMMKDDITTKDTATPTLSEEKEKEKLAGNFFNSLEPGPVLIDGGDDKDDQKVPKTTTKEPPVTKSKMDKEPTTIGTFEVIPPELIDKAFEDVERMREEADKTKPSTKTQSTDYNEEGEFGEQDDNDFTDSKDDDNESSDTSNEASESSRSDSHSQSKTSSKEKQQSKDTGGVDTEVDVQIGSKGVVIDGQAQQAPAAHRQSVVLDGEEDDRNEENSHRHEEDNDSHQEEESSSSSFLSYTLTYFFVTLGSLLILAILTIVITIAVIHSKRHTLKGTALLSEDEKVAVMKQTGYVNPTYKFFDNVAEV